MLGVRAGGCDVADKCAKACRSRAAVAVQVHWNVRHKRAIVSARADERHKWVAAHDRVGKLVVGAAEMRRHVQAGALGDGTAAA